MPWDDHTEDPLSNDESLVPRRTAMSRRSALRTVAGAGAVGLVGGGALGAAVPAVASAARPGSAESSRRGAHDEQVVVHVRDLRTGEMDIFAGTSQTRVRDRDLAARLARAAR